MQEELSDAVLPRSGDEAEEDKNFKEAPKAKKQKIQGSQAQKRKHSGLAANRS